MHEIGGLSADVIGIGQVAGCFRDAILLWFTLDLWQDCLSDVPELTIIDCKHPQASLGGKYCFRLCRDNRT